MIRKRCLRLLSHWLYVDEKLPPTSINPYKKRLVKWFTYDGFVCYSTFLSRRWIVFNIILLLLTQKVCMYTIYMDWIYSLKPNNSIQKDHTNRLNKNTNRQRYAYIVIPEKDESKNGHISLFFFSFTDKLSRYFWTPKLRFKILYPWPLGYRNNLYHWSIFGQIGHFIPELQKQLTILD